MCLIATYGQRQVSDDWIGDNTWFDTLLKRIPTHKIFWISTTLIARGHVSNCTKQAWHLAATQVSPGPNFTNKSFSILTNMADFTHMSWWHPESLVAFGPSPWEELALLQRHLTRTPLRRLARLWWHLACWNCENLMRLVITLNRIRPPLPSKLLCCIQMTGKISRNASMVILFILCLKAVWRP